MTRAKNTDYSKPFKFTKTALEGLPGYGQPQDRRSYYYDTVLAQLGVTLQESGKLTFHVRTTQNGSTRRITLERGRFPGMPVEVAREVALGVLHQTSRGIDTVAQKREERAASAVQSTTVSAAVDDYLAKKRTGEQKLPLKDRTKKDYRYDIARLLGEDLYNGSLVAVTEDIIARRMQLMEKRSKAKAASGCRALSAVWNWTRKQKENRGRMPENPVTLYAESQDGLYIPRRKKNLIPAEYLREWFDAVEALDDTNVSQFYIFLLLTGVRLNEALGLDWGQIDFKTNMYSLPDPKNREPVQLPIPSYLRDSLHRRRKRKGPVFCVPNNGRKYRAEIASAAGVNFTNHDLRRTFSTFGLRVIDLPNLKALMNHRFSGDVTLGYVQREELDLPSDLRKVNAEILRLAGRPIDNVVPLRGVSA